MFRFIRNAIMTVTSASPTSSSSVVSPPRVPIPANGVDYRGKVVLAPMVRTGELPTRLLALKYGADLVWGPETIDRAIVGATRRINPRNSMVEFARFPSNGGRQDKPTDESIIYRIDPRREKGKLIFQIGTSSPSIAVEASKVVAGDVAGIDVNAGCPKPFSTSGGMGAALLQTPDKLGEILESLVREVGNVWQIGISVKIRILPDPERTRALVTRLCATGITGLTVHCRTPPMRPRERAIRDQIPMVVSICRDAGVACLMNGDVSSREEGFALMKEFNVNGTMIATSAEANPSCFRTAAEGGLLPWRELTHEYIKTAMECENKWANTKFMINMFVPGKDRKYKDAKQTKCYEDLCSHLEYDDLLPRAREVDQIIGRSSEGDTKKIAAVQRAMEANNSAKAAGTGGSVTKTKQPNSTPTPTSTSISPAIPLAASSGNGPGPIRTHSNSFSIPSGQKQEADVHVHVPADIPEQQPLPETSSITSPLQT